MTHTSLLLSNMKKDLQVGCSKIEMSLNVVLCLTNPLNCNIE